MKGSGIKAGMIAGVFLLSFQVGMAQYDKIYETPYKTAVGIRLGGTSGLTVKQYFRPQKSVEGIFGVFGNGFSLTGLVEKNGQAFDAVGLNWYYGGGVHIAFYNGNRHYNVYGRDVIYRENHDVGVGINGIIGLEYRLPDEIPVAFSVDFKPFIEFDNDGDVGIAPDFSVGIKFLISQVTY